MSEQPIIDVEFVDIETPIDSSQAVVERGMDGGLIVDFAPEPEPIREGADRHDANLAFHMREGDLASVASKIIQMVDTDLESRSDWEERFEKGIKKLGVTEEPKSALPFEGASRVRHPLMGEACVQFQSRAIKELFPPKGPVKARILGRKDREAEDRRERVQDFMNYQYTVEMPEAFEEMDKLLFYLPLSGSAFKKTYPDDRLNRITTVFVAAEDLIVPYTATSLETAPRYTHRLKKHRNEVLKSMQSGFYRKVDLATGGIYPDTTRVDDEILRSEGRSETINTEDDVYELLESHIDYDLPGFEDTDQYGEKTGIGLPYIITVERHSQQVLSIRRNWREEDPDRVKRIWFTHYKYLPGFGFYGYGLIHMIGGLADAATGALRALLDSAQFSNMQGGFKAKSANVKSGETVVSPGQWVDVEAPPEAIRNSFIPLPYKEPSATLFNLLGFLVEAAQRFATTTEAMVGDADNKGPVGTTVALIEQGSKVFSAIHKRLHKAQGEEFKLVKELNSETITGQYPYQVEGADRYVMAEDFQSIDVEPVSDPNIFSQTQRISQAQATLQMAEAAPELHDKHEAFRRMYEALGIETDNLLIDPDDIQSMDPVNENQLMLYQKPIKAYPDQHHQAHMIVHQAWFASLPPEGQKVLEPAFMAHMAEHLALDYRNKMQSALGVALPAPEMRSTGPARFEEGQEPDAQTENMIAMAAAQAVQMLPQLSAPSMPGGGEQQQDPKAEAAAADSRRKDETAAADARRKDLIAEADIRRADAKAVADQAALDSRTAADIIRKSAQPQQGALPAPEEAQ